MSGARSWSLRERRLLRSQTERYNIMFDATAKGDKGATTAMWLLSQTGLNTKLVWSTAMLYARFNVQIGGEFRDQRAEISRGWGLHWLSAPSCMAVRFLAS